MTWSKAHYIFTKTPVQHVNVKCET